MPGEARSLPGCGIAIIKTGYGEESVRCTSMNLRSSNLGIGREGSHDGLAEYLDTK
jgi:hypothetical protein